MDLTYHDDNQFKPFVDDEQYANFFLTKWAAKASNTVFGTNFSAPTTKEKEQRSQQSISQINSMWTIDENRKNDCNYLTQRLTELQNTIKSELDKNPSPTIKQRVLSPLYDWETRYKNAIAQNKCEEKRIEAERKQERATTEEALKRVSDATTMDGTTPSNTNKYILYGVGALILVVVGIKLLK